MSQMSKAKPALVLPWRERMRNSEQNLTFQTFKIEKKLHKESTSKCNITHKV